MTAPRPIGALRHRLVLERAGFDTGGETVWTPVATVFAALTPLSGGEAVSGAGLGGLTRLRAEIRFRDDVTSRDRLRLAARIFRVVASRDLDERRRRLVLDLEEEGR